MAIDNGIRVLARVGASEAAVASLQGLATSIIGDVQGGRVLGTTALRPVNRSSIVVCGNAVTVRVRSGDNLLIHKALDLLRPGDVLVVDGEGDITRALVGEIMMTYALRQGAIGFVIDGAVRDAAAFEQAGFPCWSRGISLRGPYKEGPGSVNVPVTVGGMIVNPGDIVVGDDDGLVAIPAELAMVVAANAREKVAAEKTMIDQINARTYSSAWVDEALRAKGYKP